ncbi:MAG TPA: response regulator transcription factor [Aggregatilineales bacterium]|jgi:DNA-binding NarL/FixJ family response regulator|nr:response regulator transcription factor [Aggregatilineales bacterium]
MTTIVLADNQSIALRGLRVLLENASDIQIIGEASDGLEAVALVERLQPDMLLLDLEMPGLVGFEVAKRLRQRLPSLLILIYSGHGAFPYVRKAFEDGGVMGYIHKDDPDTCVLDAIEWVRRQQRYLSPSVLNLSPDADSDSLEACLRLYETLTDTEKELLHPLAAGLTAAQIAAERSVEESTIRTHIEHMKDKLSLTGEHMLIGDLRRVARVLTVLNPTNLLE